MLLSRCCRAALAAQDAQSMRQGLLNELDSALGCEEFDLAAWLYECGDSATGSATMVMASSFRTT